MKDDDKTRFDADIESALKKKAFGFDSRETVEEYAETEDGEIRLTKKKVTVKFVPPDVSALKMLLDMETPISALSDDELEKEKERLMTLLGSLKTDSVAAATVKEKKATVKKKTPPKKEKTLPKDKGKTP